MSEELPTDFPPLTLAEMLALDIQALIDKEETKTFKEIVEMVQVYIDKAMVGEQ